MKPMLIIAGFFVILVSCKTSKNAVAPQLVGGSEELYMYEWHLAELNGKVPAPGPKLLFSPGQVNTVTGSTGCNNLKGTMELGTNHALKFSPLAVTQKACLRANVESEFLKAIGTAAFWSVSNRQLQLIGGNKVLAKFNGITPIAGAAANLKGTWELEYISGPRIAFEGLYPDRKPTIIIEDDGRFSGNTSCNGMGGKYTVKDAALVFDAPITTMMACPGTGELTFLKTLRLIDSYGIVDGKLLLKSKGVDMMKLYKK